MRSIPLMAATTVILAAAWACGGDSNVGPNNPVANFTQTCTGLSCTFNDGSTPVGQISAWAWNFGDPNSTTNNTSTDPNPTHVFSAPGTYQVQLTVTGSGSATNSKTTAVTVTAPSNQPPVASFSIPACGAGVDCDFHSSSTDADGTIATTHWDFGDANSPNNAADGVDATHLYANPGNYNVTLTVTDDKGAPGTTTQSLTVLPAAAQECATTGSVVTCSLGITQKSTVKITMISRDCELSGNRVSVAQPQQAVFGNICQRPVPAQPYTVVDASGAPAVFAAGSQLQIVFTQGDIGPNDPPKGSARARLQGTGPNWNITVDDGGNPTAQNEPDFNDVILAIQATAAP